MKIDNLAKQLGEKLSAKNMKLVTAESCTGGGLAYVCTDVPGSSLWFERGYVTYSNQAKIDCLNVSIKTLEQFGAVSEETVKEMALGALKNSKTHLSVSISGIAGPGGGTSEKPVGTIWFGFAFSDQVQAYLCHFEGNRTSIRQQAIQFALEKLMAIC